MRCYEFASDATQFDERARKCRPLARLIRRKFSEFAILNFLWCKCKRFEKLYYALSPAARCERSVQKRTSRRQRWSLKQKKRNIEILFNRKVFLLTYNAIEHSLFLIELSQFSSISYRKQIILSYQKYQKAEIKFAKRMCLNKQLP